MALPIRTTVDDIGAVCAYFVTKPTGATVTQAKAVLDSKHLDGRKISAVKFWGLIEDSDAGKLRITPAGREYARGSEQEKRSVLGRVVASVAPYKAIVELLVHRYAK